MKHQKMPTLLLLALCIIIFIACGDNYTGPEFESLEAEINDLADQYVKIGAMIGIINKDQQRQTFSFGAKVWNTDQPPDENTVFDIGSITKTFTATLMADRVIKGEIALNSAVADYLPAEAVTLPTWNGIQMTFQHLATHTSGLPRTPHVDGSSYPRPENFETYNPYAAYAVAHVYDYLTHYCTLEFQPETWWSYSNTGVGLLGHILGLMDGTSYETILNRDIFQVLGMNNSSVNLTETQLNNHAQGYNHTYTEMPNYTTSDIFQGAGHIKSSLNDMFLYLEAQMGTPLHDAINLTHQPMLHQGSMGEQALAWFILELDDGQVITYNGGDTSGFSTYIGFNKTESTGVIILLNASFHDNTNLTLGPAILKAIMKY